MCNGICIKNSRVWYKLVYFLLHGQFLFFLWLCNFIIIQRKTGFSQEGWIEPCLAAFGWPLLLLLLLLAPSCKRIPRYWIQSNSKGRLTTFWFWLTCVACSMSVCRLLLLLLLFSSLLFSPLYNKTFLSLASQFGQVVGNGCWLDDGRAWAQNFTAPTPSRSREQFFFFFSFYKMKTRKKKILSDFLINWINAFSIFYWDEKYHQEIYTHEMFS